MRLPPFEHGLIQYGTTKVFVYGSFDILVSKWMKVLVLERARSLILFSLIRLLVLYKTKMGRGEQTYKKIWDIRPAGLLPSGLQILLRISMIILSDSEQLESLAL